jgi:hypothetical protein
MSHANWRLDNPPVVDVAVSRRMGLFVVGRLAARHGVRVRLRHAQAGGLTALIWLPDTVAAPEVVPPLGRLRRFEADDFGSAASLSAPTATSPTQGPSAASQATAAARIPRFSPTAPTTGPAAPPITGPGAPAAPSFSPAASAESPGSHASPGQGNQGVAAEGVAPAGGTLAGNNWEPAGNGWDLGSGPADHDGPPTQALPIRNGNATMPSNGNAAGDGAEPRTPASDGPNGPSSPSRLPAFTGLGPQEPKAPQAPQLPIGSQNVHGSDGPSVADAASVTNGAAGPGQGVQGDVADGQVTIPPAGQELRLPIFDSLESDWFRRSGQSIATQRPQGAQSAQSVQSAQSAQPAAQATWTSPADEGWRAAEVVAAPAAGETTQAGLPRRVPRANLVPGSVGGGGPGTSGSQGSQETEAEAPVRSPDAARSRMASLQRGVREGRAATPQIEEP